MPALIIYSIGAQDSMDSPPAAVGPGGAAGGEGRIVWVGIYIGRKRKKDRLGGGDLPRLLLNTSICVYTHMYT